jgi:hypothetical protein
MRHRLIHLINPKTDSLTTRPLYLNRALYSPLAGLLAVAAGIPRDRYEVVLTDENIEPIDFDLKADLVGISAMTSYVNRGYEIADAFRARGVPVAMGGVHPSFMPQEALTHCDAVVIGEVELVLGKLLDDLEKGQMRGAYKSDRLHPMEGLAPPRYDLLKRHRYVNSTFVQTSRGCHQGCTFCAEPLMNGLKVRYRPLQPVHEEGRRHRSQGRGRSANRGARDGAHAAHPSAEAGVARGGSGGDGKSHKTCVSSSPEPLDPARRRSTLLSSQGRAVSKVLHWVTSPESSPARNQRTRCAEEPWVKDSGETRPRVCR